MTELATTSTTVLNFTTETSSITFPSPANLAVGSGVRREVWAPEWGHLPLIVWLAAADAEAAACRTPGCRRVQGRMRTCCCSHDRSCTRRRGRPRLGLACQTAARWSRSVPSPRPWHRIGPGTGVRALTCGFRLTRAIELGVDTAAANPGRVPAPACRGCIRPVVNATAAPSKGRTRPGRWRSARHSPPRRGGSRTPRGLNRPCSSTYVEEMDDQYYPCQGLGSRCRRGA